MTIPVSKKKAIVLRGRSSWGENGNDVRLAKVQAFRAWNGQALIPPPAGQCQE